MKYIATTILIFSFFWVLAQKEFAPIGAEWYYNKAASYNPPVIGYVKHKCIKDSIIEGQKVKVLEITHSPNDYTTIFLGHEYILQKGDSIFYWKSGAFHILYNFSLQKGDSLLLYSEMLNQCEEKTNYGWSKVDSTYTTTINNVPLRAYYSSSTNGSIWGLEGIGLPIYETIGSLYYLFPQNVFCGIYDGFTQLGSLRCYTDDSLGFFQFNQRERCDSTTNYPISIDIISKNNMFEVYPNPSFDMITIDYKGNETISGFKYVLYDVIGNKRVEKGIDGNKTNIDISFLNKGSYILLIKSENKIIDYEKILKN
jgi:hypothetical protein